MTVNDAVATRILQLLTQKNMTLSVGTAIGHTTRTYAMDFEQKKQNRYAFYRDDDCQWFRNDCA